jgi:hypothetical protein
VVRIHSPRPIPSITYKGWPGKQPTQLQLRSHPSPASSSASQSADSRPALAPVIEINVRHIGRTPQPEKLTEARLRRAESTRLTGRAKARSGSAFSISTSRTLRQARPQKEGRSA